MVRLSVATKTMSRKDWLAYVRIYGPEAIAFDESWKRGDFEEVMVFRRTAMRVGIACGIFAYQTEFAIKIRNVRS